MAAMPNFNLIAGQSKTMEFTVYGPGGKNRPAALGGPDIDATTVATIDPLGSGGSVSLVPTGDSTPSRKVQWSAGAGAGAIFGARITARGKTADQFALVTAQPDESEVDFDPDTLSDPFIAS